ncbi:MULTISPECIES: glycosyltransferase family A protein [unclassified Ensifer]|uniref:glycosyltransferase family 2 protein n=1 Tax=unclassified Ensifer TaxID=2633371 RepID=UPI0008138B86|nr:MULTISPECIES: glycosyltransferase family A protein [unclassified Ensifer]OCP18653.1 hypothetical protein BC361_31765 [Ensifer sp. LC54]OCP18680.1 hypothetical protein BC363_32015 [Ensifer sp. LC384]
MPQVSIIIPTHNRAYCLPRAIRSVLLQTYRDFEIIVVDDGSTDGTERVCLEFAAAGVPLRYIGQTQSGVSAARNRGIALAQSAFVAFLDSDDIWMPHKLHRQMALMTANQNLAMSFTNFFYFSDDGKLRRKSEVINSSFVENPYPAILTIRENVVVTPSVVALKSIVEHVGGFDEAIKTCEDIDLWGRLMAHGELGALEERLVGVHTRDAEGKFPYCKNILARCDLYARAYRRDDGLTQDHLGEMLDELANCFIGVATDLGNPEPIAYLSAVVHSKLSPVAYMAELRRVARRLSLEGY